MTDRDESAATTFSPIRWGESGLELLDQTRLPREETWLVCREPEDVADMCLVLASPLARWVTGTEVEVHGGDERPGYLDAIGTDAESD